MGTLVNRHNLKRLRSVSFLVAFGVFILLVLFFIFPADTFAQDVTREGVLGNKGATYVPVVNIPGINVNEGNPLNFLRQLFFIGLTLTAFLAVVMIMWGGIQYMTTDAVSGKSEGKSRIRNAIFGLLIALLFLTVLGTINPQLTEFKFALGRITLPPIVVTNTALNVTPSNLGKTIDQASKNEHEALKKSLNSTDPNDKKARKITEYARLIATKTCPYITPLNTQPTTSRFSADAAVRRMAAYIYLILRADGSVEGFTLKDGESGSATTDRFEQNLRTTFSRITGHDASREACAGIVSTVKTPGS